MSQLHQQTSFETAPLSSLVSHVSCQLYASVSKVSHVVYKVSFPVVHTVSHVTYIFAYIYIYTGIYIASHCCFLRTNLLPLDYFLTIPHGAPPLLPDYFVEVKEMHPRSLHLASIVFHALPTFDHFSQFLQE